MWSPIRGLQDDPNALNWSASTGDHEPIEENSNQLLFKENTTLALDQRPKKRARYLVADRREALYRDKIRRDRVQLPTYHYFLVFDDLDEDLGYVESFEIGSLRKKH